MRDASFERGKRRTRRHTREARPRREHWSREYAIYAEDSWGIDDLGPRAARIPCAPIPVAAPMAIVAGAADA